MKKLIALCFFASFFLCAIIHTTATANDAGWKFVKKKKGTSLYKRPVAGSKYDEFKAEAVCDASVEALLEVLIDVENYHNWLPACIEAKKLKMFDKDPLKGNLLFYLIINAQWPVQNRDFIIKSNTTTDWVNGIVQIDLKTTDKFGYPPINGRYRVDLFTASFRFEYISRNETKVSYTTHSESGGKAPLVLVANVNKQLTFATIKKLTDMSRDPVYMKRAMRDFN